MANENLTKKDIALGGKIRCEGCGAEWWVSASQVEEFVKSGFPTICGNNAAIEIPGTRDDCTDETELVFIPYDVDENVAMFRAHGLHDVADALPAQAAKILEGVED